MARRASAAAFLASSVLLVASCSAWNDWRMEKEVQNARANARDKIDVAKCESEGGKVEGVGIFGLPACVHSYADADKSCSDDADCEGMCMTDADTPLGSIIRGRCQRDDHDAFGCYRLVVAGVAQERRCQD